MALSIFKQITTTLIHGILGLSILLGTFVMTPKTVTAEPAALEIPDVVSSPLTMLAWAAQKYYSQPEFGGLKGDYENNHHKHLLYLNGELTFFKGLFSPHTTIYFDLDDIFSAIHAGDTEQKITDEGAQGWVTVWVDAGYSLLSASLELGPISMGWNRVEMPAYETEQDITRSGYELKFLNICAIAEVSRFTKTTAGYETDVSLNDNLCLSVGGSVFNLSGQFHRFEMRYDDVLTLFNLAFPPTAVGEVYKSSTEYVSSIQNLFESLIAKNPQDDDPDNDIYELFLKSGHETRTFTSSDTGIRTPHDAAFDYVIGGIDLEGDGLPDNHYQAGYYQVFYTRFHTLGSETSDYQVKLISDLPPGWRVIPGDYDHELFDRSFDITNVWGSSDSVTTYANLPWTVIHESGSVSEVVLEFSLQRKDGLFSYDELDRLKQTFYHTDQSSNLHAPSISYDEPSPTPIVTPGDPFTVEVGVTDLDGSPIRAVDLHYELTTADGNDEVYTLPMANISGSTYRATIPGEHTLRGADSEYISSIWYHIEARDHYLVGRSPASLYHILQIEPLGDPPPVTNTYSISGYVRRSSGTGIGGATVSVGNQTTSTSGTGYYAFSSVPEGSQIIKPTMYGFTFSPSEIEVNLTSNLPNQNFTGTENRDQDTWVFPSSTSHIEDTYINEYLPNNNYGSSSAIRAGNVYSGGNYYEYWGLIRFNELKTTLSGKEVYDADLRFYVNSVTNQTRVVVHGINDPNGDWDENTVTWNNFPVSTNMLNPTPSQSITNTGWYTFDVTAMTREYVEFRPNYGYFINPSTLYYGDTYYYAAISPSESGSNWPQLTVKVLTGTPDLVIRDINLVPGPGTDLVYEVGDTVDIDFTIFNNGPGGANLTQSCVYLDSNPYDGTFDTFIDDNQSPRLLAGEDDGESEPYPFAAADTGQKYIVVEANCTRQITETDYSNNIHIYGPITIVAKNNTPTITPIPDQTVDEDTVADSLVDLWAYASDIESADSDLIYVINNSIDQNAGIYIRDNRYLSVDPLGENWNGYLDVQVKVMDPGGKYALDTLRVTVSAINDPPEIYDAMPALIGDAVNAPVVVDLTPYESDPESSGADLDWYVTGLVDGVTVSGEYSDDDVLTFTPPTDYAASQIITLHLVDLQGLEDTLDVTLGWPSKPKPGAFSKSSPSDGAPEVSTSPTLTWETSSNAAEYFYCYDTSNDNTCSNWTSTGSSTSTVLSGLSENTIYYWHVKATNSNGTTYANGSGTAFWHFTTAGSAPGSFSKISPSNGSPEVSTSPTISWSSSNGVTDYYYCYDTTDDNACNIWYGNGTSTSRVLSGLTAGTTYYWHVKAINSYGTTYSDGSPSAMWSFTTAGSAPGSFSKLNPSNGVTGVATSPTLTWQTSAGATSYEYCFDTTNDLACSNWVPNGSSTDVTLSGLNPSITYYWHVRAVNSTGTRYSNGGSSAFWHFTTFSGNTIPLPIAPQGTIWDNTPEFKWTKMDYGTTHHYHFRVWDGPVKVYEKYTDGSACGATYCTYTPEFEFMDSAYKWQVRAAIDGVWTDYSELKWFSVKAGFNSQFTSDAAGWVPTYGAWTWHLKDGNYFTSGLFQKISAAKYDQKYSIFTYEVKLRRQGTEMGSAFGVYFNGNPWPLSVQKEWNKYYAFFISRSGYYCIWKMDGGVTMNVVPWTASNLIRSGWYNTLKVTYNRNTGYTQFFINGTRVHHGYLTDLKWGNVGVRMYKSHYGWEPVLLDYAKLTMSAPSSAAESKFSGGLIFNEVDASPMEGSEGVEIFGP